MVLITLVYLQDGGGIKGRKIDFGLSSKARRILAAPSLGRQISLYQGKYFRKALKD